MPITSILLNVIDIERSVDFYTRFLGAVPIEVGTDEAGLDAVTATIRLVRLEPATETTWIPDDLQLGYRHIGFKVADLDARVAALHEAGVPFHLEPIHAEGDVRITFFFDPDGTLVELVEGALRYHEVYDLGAVEADWALGTPDQPRFDHVAESVADAHATHEHYVSRGWVLMGGIHQPHDDRGFEITFLRDGDTSIEVFAFDAEMTRREPQLDTAGFLAVEVADGMLGTAPVGPRVGRAFHVDPDGLVQTSAEA